MASFEKATEVQVYGMLNAIIQTYISVFLIISCFLYQVDNKSHDLPVVRRAEHMGRWNYDKEALHQEDSQSKLAVSR